MFNKEDLISKLRNGPCVVSFTKVNGDKRVMTCTLSSGLIPGDMAPKGVTKPSDGKDKPETDVVAVFDITAMGWRSFKVVNVYDFKSGE